ncbi:MAG: hypothetical protein IIC76_12650 [Bacteroidetes bacterium]|nr:hypothetical protein [Bacteroidota bacterium]
MSSKLFEMDKILKNFLIAILFVLTTGLGTGLIYLNYTTDYTPKGTIQRYNGTDIEQEMDDFDIPENYPKPISEMLITTHNHILGFSFIFFITGLIFYFNSIINGFWKSFLLIEPPISIVITFSSIWLMRYLHEDFVYLTIFSSIILYLSFFFMASVSVYEMKFKRIKVSE